EDHAPARLHDLSNHHERIKRLYGTSRRQNLTKFPPARNLEILSQVSQLFIYLFTGWTDVLPAPEILFMDMYISGKQAYDQGEKRRW
ncbi:hypothetical protein TNCV_3625011, partial [Trichonephila clavipes]